MAKVQKGNVVLRSGEIHHGSVPVPVLRAGDVIGLSEGCGEHPFIVYVYKKCTDRGGSHLRVLRAKVESNDEVHGAHLKTCTHGNTASSTHHVLV